MSDYNTNRPCLGKVTYTDMADAHRSAAKLCLSPYKCPLCGDWHLATKKSQYTRRKGKPSNKERRSWRR